jgi:hypothetical protein
MFCPVGCGLVVPPLNNSRQFLLSQRIRKGAVKSVVHTVGEDLLYLREAWVSAQDFLELFDWSEFRSVIKGRFPVTFDELAKVEIIYP